MKKTIIGLIPLVDEARQSYWMLPGYLEGIARAGGIGVELVDFRNWLCYHDHKRSTARIY